MYNQLVSLLSASIRFILETILNQWYRFFYTDYHLPITNYLNLKSHPFLLMDGATGRPLSPPATLSRDHKPSPI